MSARAQSTTALNDSQWRSRLVELAGTHGLDEARLMVTEEYKAVTGHKGFCAVIYVNSLLRDEAASAALSFGS